jgi:hypothetical protein
MGVAMCIEVFVDAELRTLQAAFDRACIELGVAKEDGGKREHLAMLMLSLADGETDVEAIVKQAAFQMKHPH